MVLGRCEGAEMLLAGGWMGSQRRAKGLSGGERDVTSTTMPGVGGERGLCGGGERRCCSGGGDCPVTNRHATGDVGEIVFLSGEGVGEEKADG